MNIKQSAPSIFPQKRFLFYLERDLTLRLPSLPPSLLSRHLSKDGIKAKPRSEVGRRRHTFLGSSPAAEATFVMQRRRRRDSFPSRDIDASRFSAGATFPHLRHVCLCIKRSLRRSRRLLFNPMARTEIRPLREAYSQYSCDITAKSGNPEPVSFSAADLLSRAKNRPRRA